MDLSSTFFLLRLFFLTSGMCKIIMSFGEEGEREKKGNKEDVVETAVVVERERVYMCVCMEFKLSKSTRRRARRRTTTTTSIMLADARQQDQPTKKKRLAFPSVFVCKLCCFHLCNHILP